jgi:hypothetical protein
MIIAFIGDIGSGKTLSMVKYMLDMGKKGSELFVNFKLMFPKNIIVKYLDNKFFSDYTKSKFDIKKSIVAIDECHVYFDSRNAMSKRNKMFSKFVTQSRKRTVNLIFTTQDKNPELFLASGQVELRLRKLTDFIIFCECIKKGGKKFIVQHLCDHYGFEKSRTVYEASPYYPLYDTDEIISFDEDEEP